MKKNAALFLLIILVNSSLLFAQSNYEVSSKAPFGKPNPEAPNEIKDYEQLIGICDCDSYRIGKNNNWLDPVKMTWEFKYIMNGMAIQDQTLKEDGVHSGSIRHLIPIVALGSFTIIQLLLQALVSLHGMEATLKIKSSYIKTKNHLTV